MVLMGAIIGAHGIKGEVKVKSFAGTPAAIATYGALEDAKGRSFDLTLVGQASPGKGPGGKDVLIARIKGVGDRNAAEALKGVELYVARDRLPQIAGAEEFYLADLIGLTAFDQHGNAMGKVVAVENYGAGDVLSIEGGSPGAFDVAFTRALVPVVDVAGGRLELDLPDGFFDKPEGEPEEAGATLN
ncbi:ribosome maturation factor RimM [Dongia sp.]|uniref:ribosome maturation factor RimM n=1 Tax=Dongia sp. TaxID=1977262 RepID=UPI0035B3B87F